MTPFLLTLEPERVAALKERIASEFARARAKGYTTIEMGTTKDPLEHGNRARERPRHLALK